MKNINFFVFFLFFGLLSSESFGKVIKSSEYFKKYGKVDSFRWAPTNYESDFRYDIFYYIPKKLKKATNAKALIFLHGGGQSTMDRSGSIWAVNLYMDILVDVANDLGMIVILPSANGLNWGGHTRGFLSELARLTRSELDIDPNHLGLSGHSMGGMGITRSFLWLADEFAYFLPQAAGMDEKGQTEEILSKVFNVPYIHLQGTYDHFDIFTARCKEQLKKTQELEAKFGVASKLQMVLYNGDHNIDYDRFIKHLSDASQIPRNFYQKELWGSLHTSERKFTENNITFFQGAKNRYFWLEVLDTDFTTPERLVFHAKINGNTINIDFDKIPEFSKTLRVYLDSRMIDLTSPIEIFLNGKLTATRAPSPGALRQMSEFDSRFEFEDFFDFPIPKNTEPVVGTTEIMSEVIR